MMILLLLILFIAYGRLVGCQSFVGSKLGTTEYNQERIAIEFGVSDRKDILRKYRVWKPRPLLCATFASSKVATTILADNIKIMGNQCDWAVIYYDDDELEIMKRCAELTNTVHCRMFPMGTRTNVTLPSGNANVTLGIPKTVLYTELLPYLSFYRKVFLMDEDISLTGFNISTFMDVWNCAFGKYPPLVVQPLIAGKGQYITYVNSDAWKNYTDVWAAEVGLVEQQVPMFDSIFFEWFVRRVLSQTYSLALKHGVDWGHDRSWCNAAHMYSTVVLGQSSSNDSIVCAILVKGGSVHHMNGRTMTVKKLHRGHHYTNGIRIVQQYINLFPTWVISDVLGSANPLVEDSTLQMIHSVNQSCIITGGGVGGGG